MSPRGRRALSRAPLAIGARSSLDDVDGDGDRCWLSGGIVHLNGPTEDGVDVRIMRNRWGAPTYHTPGSGDPMYVLMRAGQE